MLGTRSATSRLVERVARRCALAQDPLDLLEQVAGILAARLDYAAGGWILIDPDTLLMTGVYAENVDRAQHLELIAYELTEPDVNKFWDLTRRGVAAAALSADTDGDLARSARWARIYGPAGFGDELRVVFASGGVAWGHACLTRRAEQEPYTAADVALMKRIAPHVGNGIRICHLLSDLSGATGTGAAPGGGDAHADTPALVMLADDGAVESASHRARAWLGPLDDERLQTTIVLHEVANRAKALASGSDGGPAAMARLRARTGEWLVVRGARLARGGGEGDAAGGDDAGSRTALVLEPARRSDLAPLLLDLHRLTRREQEVTQLLLWGMSTAEIAAELWISQETVRGHVKSVFAKLGVSSRPELAALLSSPPRSRVRPDAPSGPRTR